MSLWEAYRSRSVDSGDRVALIDPDGGTLTHEQLWNQALNAAGRFDAEGLIPGDHVGVFLPNRLSWMIASLAGSMAGVGVVGLNTRFRKAELDHLLAVASITTVVTAPEFFGIDAMQILDGLDDPPTVILEDQLVDTASVEDDAEPPGRPEHPLIGFTTSGTTGFPKVAMHEQSGTVTHLLNVVDRQGFDSSTVALVPLPLCGTFGYTTAWAPLLAGGVAVIQEAWDPGQAIGLMDQHRVTYFNGADNMILDVLNHPDFDLETTWRRGGVGDFTNGALAAVQRAEELTHNKLILTGIYGSSEGFALMSSWPADMPAGERARSGGILTADSMSVRCVDPEAVNNAAPSALPHGEPGELHFRGPNLITRYLNNDQASAAAFTADGWYRSGDLGFTVDARSYVFLARLGDSLRLRGFLCDPSEIEQHLENHPAVELAQVVGVHRQGQGQGEGGSEGEVAVAFVRAKAGEETEDLVALLTDHCRQGLANYKCPTHIELVDDFPVTDGPNGVKIRKVELRERAVALLT